MPPKKKYVIISISVYLDVPKTVLRFEIFDNISKYILTSTWNPYNLVNGGWWKALVFYIFTNAHTVSWFVNAPVSFQKSYIISPPPLPPLSLSFSGILTFTFSPPLFIHSWIYILQKSYFFHIGSDNRNFMWREELSFEHEATHCVFGIVFQNTFERLYMQIRDIETYIKLTEFHRYTVLRRAHNLFRF